MEPPEPSGASKGLEGFTGGIHPTTNPPHTWNLDHDTDLGGLGALVFCVCMCVFVWLCVLFSWRLLGSSQAVEAGGEGWEKGKGTRSLSSCFKRLGFLQASKQARFPFSRVTRRMFQQLQYNPPVFELTGSGRMCKSFFRTLYTTGFHVDSFHAGP